MNSLKWRGLLRAGVRVPLMVALLATPARADEAVDRLIEAGVSEAPAQHLVERWGEAHPDGIEELVAILVAAIAAEAPPDLVVDKAAEGLAKGIPAARLLPALTAWSEQIAQAAGLAAVLQEELEPGGMTRRGIVLRLHLLQRARDDDAWLNRLRQDARRTGANIADLLAVGESVGQLTRLGLSEGEAEDLGRRWLDSGVDAIAAPSLLRAIETARDAMPLAAAAEHVTERTGEGWTADEVLLEVNTAISSGQPLDLQGRDRLPAARGMGTELPVGREPTDDAGREIDDAGRLHDENGRPIGERVDPTDVSEDEDGRGTDTNGEGEVQDRDSQEIDDEKETDANGRG